jgi:hypothetical protein
MDKQENRLDADTADPNSAVMSEDELESVAGGRRHPMPIAGNPAQAPPEPVTLGAEGAPITTALPNATDLNIGTTHDSKKG